MTTVDAGTWTGPSRLQTRRARIGISLAVLAALVGGALWLALRHAADSGVARLPERERRELFQRTMADITLCATEAGGSIAEHCAHQAELVTQFPECDATCRDLASRWGERPTR